MNSFLLISQDYQKKQQTNFRSKKFPTILLILQLKIVIKISIAITKQKNYIQSCSQKILNQIYKKQQMRSFSVDRNPYHCRPFMKADRETLASSRYSPSESTQSPNANDHSIEKQNALKFNELGQEYLKLSKFKQAFNMFQMSIRSFYSKRQQMLNSQPIGKQPNSKEILISRYWMMVEREPKLANAFSAISLIIEVVDNLTEICVILEQLVAIYPGTGMLHILLSRALARNQKKQVLDKVDDYQLKNGRSLTQRTNVNYLSGYRRAQTPHNNFKMTRQRQQTQLGKNPFHTNFKNQQRTKTQPQTTKNTQYYSEKPISKIGSSSSAIPLIHSSIGSQIETKIDMPIYSKQSLYQQSIMNDKAHKLKKINQNQSTHQIQQSIISAGDLDEEIAHALEQLKKMSDECQETLDSLKEKKSIWRFFNLDQLSSHSLFFDESQYESILDSSIDEQDPIDMLQKGQRSHLETESILQPTPLSVNKSPQSKWLLASQQSKPLTSRISIPQKPTNTTTKRKSQRYAHLEQSSSQRKIIHQSCTSNEEEIPHNDTISPEFIIK